MVGKLKKSAKLASVGVMERQRISEYTARLKTLTLHSFSLFTSM
jgi:hypothetical protein